MAHPFGNPSFSRNAYSGAAEYEGSLGRSSVFLVAIHGGLFTPPTHERNPMQPMRVVVLPPSQASEFESSDLLPGVFRHALPPIPPALPMPQEKRLQPRPVRGEILRGLQGRLYEKIGEQIRPLHKLVSGSRGQVFELVPPEEPTPEITVQADSNDPSQEFARPQHGNFLRSSRQRKENGELNHASPVTQPVAQNPKPVPYRKPLPRSGTKLRDPIGRFQIAACAAIGSSRARARYASARLLSSSLRGHHSSAFGIIGRFSSRGCRSRQPTSAYYRTHHSAAWAHLAFTDPPSRSRPFSTGGWIAPAPRKSFSASARTRPDSRRCDAGGTATVNALSSDGDVCLG